MKLTKEDKGLIQKAEKLWKKKYVSKKPSVSAIVLTSKGNIFEGMSMEDIQTRICAERTAFFKMMPDEKEIKTIVAVYKDKVIPPCGICREIMYDMSEKNLETTWVIVSKKQKVKLKELFPFPWKEAF
jgi:cytidine deaminase